MPPLADEFRRDLERAVIAARETAEAGAQNALVVLGVADDRAPDGLTAEDRALRVALRAQARSLGNALTFDGMAALREEIAYSAWHRMLFARFLAENGLLVEPASGAPVSLADVAELAQETGEADPWVLAARYASAMLPGIFGTADPTTRVAFSPDDRLRLEAILRGLPKEVFSADDALGWVYQFWQSKRKDEVNAAGRRVGGSDLAAVTQLFTEHYMVRFLLENSLGAWWAGKHPDSPLLREWEYLRFRDDGTPAAGTFEGRPARAAEVTVMDPCMGSGHFLVVAGDMLRRMRMEEEGLTAGGAAEAVLGENLFGLELDPRCTQLGAFALAFDAWKAAGGYRVLPVPNIACSGLAVRGQRDEWRRLAGSDTLLGAALEHLYDVFQDAPELGSLIDPRSAAGEGLWAVDPEKLLAKLDQALARETDDPAAEVFGAAAQGTAKAARLLANRYWLVATNPPFMGRSGQSRPLAAYVISRFADAKDDLAAAFLLRMLELASTSGTVASVIPQYVFFLRMFGKARCSLRAHELSMLARLGSGAFQTISGEVVKVGLGVLRSGRQPADHATVPAIDADDIAGVSSKAAMLRVGNLFDVPVGHGLDPFVFAPVTTLPSLGDRARGWQGLVTADLNRFALRYWELGEGAFPSRTWAPFVSAPDRTGHYRGRSLALRWEDGRGALVRNSGAHNFNPSSVRDRAGVLVAQAGSLSATLYLGEFFNDASSPLIPVDPSHLLPIWAYCSSDEYRRAVRARNQKLIVGPGYLTEVPFDLAHWTHVAAEQYPDGLPEPHSDDPTQWLFKGNVVGSEVSLQVAVARLLGYRWPEQKSDELDAFADPDGIVCLPAVSGEAPAAERLEGFLAAAYGAGWSPVKRRELLAEVSAKATTLDAWLRDEFFEQHARLFHNRPFIWQVWDGRKDGFSALLHYHRLDRATLEKLTYSHLGDWLERQRAGIAAGEAGAEARLAAATALQRALANILEGEPPYDIYVRWKSLAEQPIGWEPDLADGVRLNIRPFVKAGIPRAKFTINWNKDRGNDPDGSERVNERRLSVAEKRAARQ